MNKYDDAHKNWRRALELLGVFPELISNYDSLYTVLGPKAYPRWLLNNRSKLNDWLYKSLSDEAWIYSRLGDYEKALYLLEKAYEEKEGELVTLKTDPKWDQIRGESRFQKLISLIDFNN